MTPFSKIKLIHAYDTITANTLVNLTNNLIYNVGTTGLSTATQFTTVADDISICQIDENKFVATFQDPDNSDQGTAVVISVDPDTYVITMGAELVFETGTTMYTNVCKIDTDKALVCYRDNSDSGKGKAVVLSASGTTLSAGSIVDIDTNDCIDLKIDQLDTDKSIVLYTDTTGSLVEAVVLSISGTTITVNTPVTVHAGNTQIKNIRYLDTDKALVCYRDASSYAKAVVLSISGTTITVNSAVTVHSASSSDLCIAVLSSAKAIIAYEVSSVYYARALSISGNTITVSDSTTVAGNISYACICKNTDSQALVVLRDAGTGNVESYDLFYTQNSTITVSAKSTLSTDNVNEIAIIPDITYHFMLIYDTANAKAMWLRSYVANGYALTSSNGKVAYAKF